MEKSNGPFPPELLLSIFMYLDGLSLAECNKVCRQWSMLLSHYDDLIWPYACQRDFQSSNARRFWSLQFPAPRYSQLWQDMYRITRNWFTGHCRGFYPTITKSPIQKRQPCSVIGAPQEQGMFTSLTIASDGRIVRSNPNYHTSHQSLIIQSSLNKQCSSLYAMPNNHVRGWPDAGRAHSIVCHYTHPSSSWLVTGGLNGSVALWDLNTKEIIRIWHGHRGRVLCVSMNDDVVVSGGSDNMILVWDIVKTNEPVNRHKPTRRGAINIAAYLSGRIDWYQGVGEIAINGHLIACAPDASGPILVFSVLTGSLVYEIRPGEAVENEWMTEDITAFSRLCLTPFFLLTKGKVTHATNTIKLVPSDQNVVVQRSQKPTNPGYVTHLHESSSRPPLPQMTPYQLYRHYQSINSTQEEEDELHAMPQTSACINVWDLQTRKTKYRLVPTLPLPHQNYTITDVRVTPDYSKVFASIETRGQRSYEERVFCWDFSVTHLDEATQHFDIVELDTADPQARKTGKSWVCFV
ncbi:putative E3 ubiquitin ligase complex SCF subunit sconB [Choanephora cucurbitarum]|uniref:Putative E3 ubiquitin ligase complex SCF subunit sconB n=1 Tax=Choanephora cucurbitarum TaxID=101091 RepID=A0A1C7MYE0_9FUNG|nr:putative E3 ubiquitin ligase complex SCF subunit sconB [Choanephora cucurbitarum]